MRMPTPICSLVYRPAYAVLPKMRGSRVQRISCTLIVNSRLPDRFRSSFTLNSREMREGSSALSRLMLRLNVVLDPMPETLAPALIAAPDGPLIVPPLRESKAVFSLIVPTFNESENIVSFLLAVREALDPVFGGSYE